MKRKQHVLIGGLIGILLTAANVVQAQTTEAKKSDDDFEISFGVAATPLVHTTVAPGDTFVYSEGKRLGWYGTLLIPFHGAIGAEVEGLGTYGRFEPNKGSGVVSNQFAGGLRYSDRKLSSKFVPYVNVLTGMSSRTYRLSHTGYNWIGQIGAGVNIYTTEHLGLNIGAGYVRPITNRKFDQVMFTAGIVLR
jgi:hypothetical protein